jgi:RimJ/RimL family protein N-acetyltransferase
MTTTRPGSASNDSTPAARPAAPRFLSAFQPAHAATVANWVCNDEELEWLAPATPAPLTAEKVIAWGQERRRRILLWIEGHPRPCAYGELNDMPQRAGGLWIGHFIVDPAQRGRGLGRRFVQAMLAQGFLQLGAGDVSLVVFPDNRQAVRCYEQAGLTILGTERKHFPATDREHEFLRMGIDAAEYRRQVAAGRIDGRLLPFQAWT